MPKRIGHIYEKICTLQNIEQADEVARIGKSCVKQIRKHDKNKLIENQLLVQNLDSLQYTTSPYHLFPIKDTKYRIISSLPYYPDRIAHRAILNFCTPIWDKVIYPKSFSCIKGRGIHNLVHDIELCLKLHPELKFAAKLDYCKYFPSVDHDNIKQVVRRKIKDPRFNYTFDGIIDSHEGIPIGSWPSQYLGNLYPSYLFHKIASLFKIKLFIYMDDAIMLGETANELHKAVKYYIEHSKSELKMTVKRTFQVFPIAIRGIDIVGYRIFPTHTILRKSIKIRIKKLIKKYKQHKITKETLMSSLNSYFGWLKHCDSKHFLQYLERETGIHYSNFNGTLKGIKWFKNRNVRVIHIMQRPKYSIIQCIYRGEPYETRTSDKQLLKKLSRWMEFGPFNWKF